MADEPFRFGLEGEYLLVDLAGFRPLWHPDLSFASLNAILESIPHEPLLRGLSLEGLELDPPHLRIMPYHVEGYGLPDAELNRWIDMLPKGVEIRTPISPSLEICLEVYEELYQALQRALGESGYRAVALAHHPTAWGFQGPRNHLRDDWWQWGMQAMTTYGPDLNLSLPERLRAGFDWDALQRRANFYAPAMVAFSLAAPVGRGRLWEVDGRHGLSLRTERRSPYAPAVAAHPKEGGRLEFKAFDMPMKRSDLHPYFLLWIWLASDDRAPGRADDQQRNDDLAAVARLGWEVKRIVGRAEEILDRARSVLARLDLDPAPIEILRSRLLERRTPAEEIIRRLECESSIPELLRWLDQIAAAPRASTTSRLG